MTSSRHRLPNANARCIHDYLAAHVQVSVECCPADRLPDRGDAGAGVPAQEGLCCSVLYCTVLHCTVLYCAVGLRPQGGELAAAGGAPEEPVPQADRQAERARGGLPHQGHAGDNTIVTNRKHFLLTPNPVLCPDEHGSDGH